MKQAPHTTEMDTPRPLTETGTLVIKARLKTLPDAPGVYRMLDRDGAVLYVGKAKNLKKRVAAYTRPEQQSIRIQRMIARTADMEFVTTHTEAEALLLEANLIKSLAPRYNILLRDDKSFPFILLTGGHDFPRVVKHRGARSAEGSYFGPFASAWAVNQTLTVLQRAFLLRSCTDSVFANRARPCLLYQIKRCAAPCVDLVSAREYAVLVNQARDFLAGHSKRIQEDLARGMEAASDALEFEVAAQFRDRIRAMTSVQAHQDIHVEGLGDADVIAAHQEAGQTSVQVFFYRGGANYGNRAYFPAHAKEAEIGQVLEAFVGQFYANKQPPRAILLHPRVPQADILQEALSVKAGHGVRLQFPARGAKRKLVDNALLNARQALSRRLAENASQRRLLEELAVSLKLDTVPERIEIYDNSHISGTNAVGAMVVAGPEGMIKNAYRKFNIRRDQGEAAGDDYAMMREVLGRRFRRALKEDPDRAGSGEGRWAWPDLLLIDGGKGQLGAVLETLQDLGIDDVAVAAVAKGPERNAGRERIFLPDREPLELAPRDPVLYFIQRLRDEAHRFAIGSHRSRRQADTRRSALDEIPGVGGRRKKALLHHFGSARNVAQAGLEDLSAVDGISRSLAKKIYEHFHGDG